MKNFLSTLPTTLLILAALMVVSAAPPPSGTEAATEAAVADVSTEPEHPTVDSGELRDFAEVFLAVAAVRHRFHRERATATDDQDAARLERRAEARLRGIFAQSPMTLDRYTEIGKILTEDAEQRRRFEDLVLEMTGGSPGPEADVPPSTDAA